MRLGGNESGPRDISPFTAMIADLQVARMLWNKGQGLVQHRSQLQPAPVREFLLEGGINTDSFDFFDESGMFLEKADPEFDFETIQPSTLEEILVRRLHQVYECGNQSLDAGHENGFNQHGLTDHILPMYLLGMEYAARLGMDEREIKVLILKIFAHDLGNVLSRSKHPYISSWIFERLMPELKGEPYRQLRSEIRHDVILHDEKVASRWVDFYDQQLRRDHGNNYSEELLYAKLKERFGRDALLLIALDKSSALDRQRVTRKKNLDGSDMMSDMHTLTCALGVTEKTGYDSEGNRITMHRTLDFMPGIGEVNKEDGVFLPSAPGEKHSDKVFVPPQMSRLHRDHGIPHFFTWMSQIWAINLDRFNLEMLSLFSLFPQMNKFTLIIQDASDYDTAGVTLKFMYSVRRGKVQPFARWLKHNMAGPDKGDEVSIHTIPELYKKARDFGRNLLRSSSILGEIDSLTKGHYVGDTDPWLQIQYVFNPAFKTQTGICQMQNHLLKLFHPKQQRLD